MRLYAAVSRLGRPARGRRARSPAGARGYRWLTLGSRGNRSELEGPDGGIGGEAVAPKATLRARLGRYVRAVRDGDEVMVEQAIVQLSQSRRLFAPLAFMVGGLGMLFDGLKLLFTNWRLTLVQILPAMWIWVVMLDWKAHVLHGESFHVVQGPILIPAVLAIAAVTAATFFLNAVFGFAVSGPQPPQVRPAFAQARSRRRRSWCPASWSVCCSASR